MGDTLCGRGERVDVRPRGCWRAELDSSRASALGDAPHTSRAVSTHPASQSQPEHLELPVVELFRRARPLSDHDEMVIEYLSEDEGEAFLAAVESSRRSHMDRTPHSLRFPCGCVLAALW